MPYKYKQQKRRFPNFFVQNELLHTIGKSIFLPKQLIFAIYGAYY